MYQQLKTQISIQDEFIKNKIYSKFHKTKKTKSRIWTNKFTKELSGKIIKIKEIKTENESYSVRSLNCNYKSDKTNKP